jgi:hypothetical protein
LKAIIEKVGLGDIHAKGYENLMVDYVSLGSWLGTLFIVCFLITGVLVLLAAIICTWNYPMARGWIGTQNNQTHSPRDYNVDYHRNRDFSDNEEEELSRSVRRASMNRAGTQSTVTTRESPPPLHSPGHTICTRPIKMTITNQYVKNEKYKINIPSSMPMEVGFLTQVPMKSDTLKTLQGEGWIVTGLITDFCDIWTPKNRLYHI